MNQSTQLTTNSAAPTLPVPIMMFEVMEVAVPIQLTGNFAMQDKLREDKDLVEDFRNTQGPTCWSPLNDF